MPLELHQYNYPHLRVLLHVSGPIDPDCLAHPSTTLNPANDPLHSVQRRPRVAVLLVELSALSIYRDAPTFLETLTMIDTLGFDSAGMSEVSRQGARVIEYDGVFVRRDC